jgi:hypothetical protein
VIVAIEVLLSAAIVGCAIRTVWICTRIAAQHVQWRRSRRRLRPSFAVRGDRRDRERRLGRRYER